MGEASGRGSPLKPAERSTPSLEAETTSCAQGAILGKSLIGSHPVGKTAARPNPARRVLVAADHRRRAAILHQRADTSKAVGGA